MPYIKRDPQKALDLILSCSRGAEAEGAQIVCFPECFLQGYELDLETANWGIDLASTEFKEILIRLSQIRTLIVFGLIERDCGRTFNTAVVVQSGVLLGRYRKTQLVGFEKEIFTPGDDFPVFFEQGVRFGINICYDLNFPECAKAVADQGASLLVCLSNNMLNRPIAEKWKDKHNPSRSARCVETGLWLVSSDVTGEVDNRVGYGPTAFINPKGKIVCQLPLMEPGVLIHEVQLCEPRRS